METDKLTCIGCWMIFDNQSDQVAHYKTDFHRFNLKRKMVNLPAVTEQQFNEKVQAIKQADDDSNKKSTPSCSVCHKKFSSEGAYNTHINSKKHKDAVRDSSSSSSPPQDDTTNSNPLPPSSDTTNTSIISSDDKGKEKVVIEDIKEDESSTTSRKNLTMEEIIDEKIKNATTLELDDCLFCCKKQPDFDTNLVHMQKEHGFFLPDREYLKDPQGLITYLGEKIAIGNVCIWCNERSPYFSSMSAVQNHMNALAHCKLA